MLFDFFKRKRKEIRPSPRIITNMSVTPSPRIKTQGFQHVAQICVDDSLQRSANTKKKIFRIRRYHNYHLPVFSAYDFAKLSASRLAKHAVSTEEIVLRQNGKIVRMSLNFSVTSSYFLYEWKEPFYFVFHRLPSFEEFWLIENCIAHIPHFIGYIYFTNGEYQKITFG